MGVRDYFGGQRYEINEVLDHLGGVRPSTESKFATLTAINAELQRRLLKKPFVSGRTISTRSEGMLFTRKLAHRVPAERNRQDVIERRHGYAHWFLEEANLHHTVLMSVGTTYGILRLP